MPHNAADTPFRGMAGGAGSRGRPEGPYAISKINRGPEHRQEGSCAWPGWKLEMATVRILTKAAGSEETGWRMDVLSIDSAPEIIAARTRAIYEAMLQQSRQIRQGNFTVIATDDVARLFYLYDEHFFGGGLTKTVAEKAAGPMSFRLSRTMSRAGGKTIQRRRMAPDGKRQTYYEIVIASRLLFMTFGNIERPVIVCGLNCQDRLQAMQRIMEHEIIHLIELLTWGQSSCSACRFKTLAGRLFGHTQPTHDLLTPPEHAAVQHGIRVGSMVEFEFEGQRHVGRVNRINHRATILVESSGGMRYSDGKSYEKFYVPLGLLKPALIVVS
jgi:hypothetical protein